ncbi:MAG: hypothetical protein IT455_02100 [Planctomycetes bacterium]|nr:hypothetical protein [Planctomycetota bacterium]
MIAARSPFVLTLLLALPLPAQQEPPTMAAGNAEWAKDVERAASAPRYGLRLAAARKVAGAGAAAVPAIREFAAQRTFDSPMLIDAIADADSVEAPVLDLLREWATQRDFYWRGAALRGLARRAERLPRDGDDLAAWFHSFHQDPSWLMRAYSRFGSLLLGNGEVFAEPEPDPRARVRLAALALGAGRMPPLQPLLDALVDRRTFLGDPWAKRSADEAQKALKAWLGDGWPATANDLDDRAGLDALRTLLQTKSTQTLHAPAPVADPQPAPTGGFEVMSCRNGDLFVSWSAAGEVRFGLDGADVVTLAGPVWDELSRLRAALPPFADGGVVICDNLRLCWSAPDVNLRIAPGRMPTAADEWLKRLARAIEEASAPSLASGMRTRFEQFASR